MKKSNWQNGIPEKFSGGDAAYHYHEKEAERYTSTSQTIQIQHDLTRRALEVLHLIRPSPLAVSSPATTPFILDVGCGSGLSGRVITHSTGLPWIGTDIAAAMLRLAQSTEATGCGRLCLSDMSQGLPFRAATFDAVISISAVQWLCSAADPQAACSMFFKSLYSCVKAGGCAALQIYIQDDEHTALLLSSATAAGFSAGYFVDFPHQSSAKKYYICLYKPPQQQQEKQRLLIQPNAGNCCNLSWPRVGSCMLTWTRFYQTTVQPGSSTSAVTLLRARLQNEHAQTARRTLRLLRRAMDQVFKSSSAVVHSQKDLGNVSSSAEESTAELDALQLQQESTSLPTSLPVSGSPSPSRRSIVFAEAEVSSHSLMPCGGGIYVNITVAQEDLPYLARSATSSPALMTRSNTIINTQIDNAENGSRIGGLEDSLTSAPSLDHSHGEVDVCALEGLAETHSLLEWLLSVNPVEKNRTCTKTTSMNTRCTRSSDSCTDSRAVVLDCNLISAPETAASLLDVHWTGELQSVVQQLAGAILPEPVVPHKARKTIRKPTTGDIYNRESIDESEMDNGSRKNGGDKSKAPFFWLEPLSPSPCPIDAQGAHVEEQKMSSLSISSSVGCILHAHKLPPLLVIPIDGWNVAGCENIPSGRKEGEMQDRQGQSALHPSSVVVEICRAIQGSLVAVDARLKTANDTSSSVNGCSSVWLIYAASLQEANRKELASTIQTVLSTSLDVYRKV